MSEKEIAHDRWGWELTSVRYVAFLDIMGFKDFIYRHSHAVVEKRMRVLSEIVSHHTQEQTIHLTIDVDNETTSPASVEVTIRSVMFSDSILVVAKDDSEDSLVNLMRACADIVHKCLTNDIGIKGAISCGKFTADFDKSLYFGKPLIDAFYLQEELMFYGCIIDNTCEKRISKFKELNKGHDNYKGLFKQLKAPLKSGKVTHFVIDIFSRYTDTSEKIIKSLYNTVSGKPRIYVDNTETVFATLARLEEANKMLESEIITNSARLLASALVNSKKDKRIK